MPTPSPTPIRGQYLLYKVSIPNSGGFTPQIWVVKPDGTGRRKIADGPNLPIASPPTHDIDAVWSHDGSAIHVVKYSAGTSDATHCMPTITNYSIDSGSVHVVGASLTNHDDNFIWSPDDTRIVFRHWVGQPDCVMDGFDDRTDLVMMNANGTGRHTIATNVSYDVTSWASDGTSLIGDDKSTYRPVLVNPTTGVATPIGPPSAQGWSVSADGTGIAFLVSDRLHVVNSNGTGAIDLSAPPATDYGPVWSPDGTAIAVQRTRGAKTNVDVIRLPSPAATVLPGITSAGQKETPCWSPDGTRIAVAVNAGPVVVVNSNGTGAVSVPGVTSVYLLAWQPQ
jgi:Tol biopolymer transport system component